MVDADSEVILELTEAGVGVEVPPLLVGLPGAVAEKAAHDTVNSWFDCTLAGTARHFLR